MAAVSEMLSDVHQVFKFSSSYPMINCKMQDRTWYNLIARVLKNVNEGNVTQNTTELY